METQSSRGLQYILRARLLRLLFWGGRRELQGASQRKADSNKARTGRANKTCGRQRPGLRNSQETPPTLGKREKGQENQTRKSEQTTRDQEKKTRDQAEEQENQELGDHPKDTHNPLDRPASAALPIGTQQGTWADLTTTPHLPKLTPNQKTRLANS